MATIGTLAAKVVADTSGFTMGMTSVRKELAETQRAASSDGGMQLVFDPINAGIEAAKIGFAALRATIQGVADVVGTAFDRVQDIGNAAQSLGIGVQAFQVLQIAASDADVEMETLTRGIYEMQKSLAAGGTAEKSIASLGLSFKEIKGMSPEDQFAAIAGAIGDITDQSTRVKVINDLFGKSGLELKRLFDGGLEAIEDATKKLDRMGAVTEADVKAIGEWDSAWKELNGTIAGVGTVLVRELAPTFKDVIGDITMWLQSPQNQNFIKGMIDVIGLAAETAKILVRGFLIAIQPVVDKVLELKRWHDWFLGLPEMVEMTPEAQARWNALQDKKRKEAYEKEMGDVSGELPKGLSADNLADDAKKLLDSLRTPFEVIEDKIKHFRMLADLGYIGEGDFDKLTADAIDDLRAPPKQEFKNQAMAFGSQSAIQFLANQKYGDPNKATWDAMRKALDQIAKNTKPQKEAGPAVVPAF